MTIAMKLHNSATHRKGFDPNCPRCIWVYGINGIIQHLEKCAAQNEKDAKAAAQFEPPLHHCATDAAVAAEQRRMIGVLKLYQKLEVR